MNTYKNFSSAAVLATAVVMLGGSPASAFVTQEEPAGTSVERERGIVMECVGEADGLQAYASLYENNRYGNHLQVVLGDPDAGNGRSKLVKRRILEDGTVRAAITIDGARARIKGTAARVGKKEHVHEELDDAGYHVTSDGTHRRIVTDLELRYDGAVVPLTCDPAFAYALKVTKTPIV